MDFTQLAPIPRSTATNAYDLLTEVIDAILTEPKRLLMDQWVVPPEEFLRHFDEQPMYNLRNQGLGDVYYQAPACGTMGCVAGWIVLMRMGLEEADKLVTESTAVNQIVGPTPDDLYTKDEFGWNDDVKDEYKAWYDMRQELRNLFQTFPDKLANLIPQTPEYAAFVVERIRGFQAGHADMLRARAL